MAGTILLNDARRALSSLGRRGKTTKIPGPIRDVVMAYVQSAGRVPPHRGFPRCR